jgi:hypothetical protein
MVFRLPVVVARSSGMSTTFEACVASCLYNAGCVGILISFVEGNIVDNSR